LIDYSETKPKFRSRYDKRTNKTYHTLYFQTKSLPFFNYYHSLFYDSLGKKIIPSNISELLTPIGLAYWAMDDGGKSRSNYYLNTDSFSLVEIQLLIKVLKDKFELNCTYHIKRKGQYRIYILIDSMSKFRQIVAPYFHPSMLYKLSS
jgi:hypothetical protein